MEGRTLHSGTESTYRSLYFEFAGYTYGAKLATPSGLRVEIHPIGRGTTQDLKGFRGSACSVTLGS